MIIYAGQGTELQPDLQRHQPPEPDPECGGQQRDARARARGRESLQDARGPQPDLRQEIQMIYIIKL